MTTCVIEGCGSLQCNGRGWCWKHYTRWRRGKRIEDPTLLEVLEEGLDTVGGKDSCWEWTLTRHSHGYGLVGDNRYVHRLVTEVVIGRELSKSEYVCHRCDNPPCANPWHLFIGTQRDNMMDYADKYGVPGKVEGLDLDAIRWLHGQKVRAPAIAKVLGVSSTVIHHRIKELGLKPHPIGAPSPAHKEQAARALASLGGDAA